MFGKSWSEDKLAAFSKPTCWSSFPYFTWVLSSVLGWSPTHTKAAERRKTGMMHNAVWYAKQTYQLQFAPKQKQCIFRAQSNRGLVTGGSGLYFCWKLDYSKSPSVFWHYLHKFCIAAGVVFTDQSCSVKFRIIALLSPFWHSLCRSAHFKQETAFSKNELSQFFVCHILFRVIWGEKCANKNPLFATFRCEDTKSHCGNADTAGLLVTERQGLISLSCTVSSTQNNCDSLKCLDICLWKKVSLRHPTAYAVA